ncbi:GAF domain-containing protein [Deinococcus cavernae]|uniref:GAF domain-containing protein n=1 Tax=Deinococcus cavernae TaxID=2320857 RepID=A0A418V8F6_9DEIO|nr:GAF domain-containing protein [Deinococcus cavernae]RJF72393.1 GAF domain-containing protein [Deinococcus cavernae]
MPADVLSTVSWAAETLNRDPRQLFHVVRVLLDDLRRFTGMDAAELYLADPQQKYLLLSGYAGKDQEAFFERSVFQFGEGFPGIAAQSREPVLTKTLESDHRYLREQVKALGYRCFISFPLVLPHAVVGVLNLASQQVGQAQEARRQLALISPLLAASLYAVMTSLSERTLERVRQAATPRERALALLEDGLLTTSARRAILHPLRGADIETHPGQLGPCAGLHACPAKQGEVCISGHAELHCEFQSAAGRLMCLPMWEGGQVTAVQTVQLPQEAAEVPTQTAAPLLWMGRLAYGVLGLEKDVPVQHAPWLSIETFGAFRVRRGGEVLSPKQFKRRQSYQLLKILVTRCGRAMSTDELCEALWPDEPTDPKVLARLHVTLNVLRQVVEPDPERQQVILRDGNSYRFAPTTHCVLDAQELEALVRWGDAQAGLEAVATYAGALALYRGHFMEEDTYAEWCALERDYYRELMIRSLFRTAEIQEAAGLLPDTQATYSHILTLDPHRFEAYESLIDFLRQHGRSADAQVYLEKYAQAYGGPPPRWHAGKGADARL